MPDPSISEALAEAYASAPADEVILHTIELLHPAFLDAGQPVGVRVVRDTQNHTLTLEAGAPLDAGQAVEFTGMAFEFSRPDVLPDGSPVVQLEVDNVSRELMRHLDAAAMSPDQVTLIYREYLASDPTGPQNDPPLQLTLLSVSADSLRVRGQAGFVQVANRRFPNVDYTPEAFPGLVAR